MDTKLSSDDPLLRGSRLFVPAGTSALLLSVAHVEPDLWFISLVALIPYLWKLKRADRTDSILLGILFAACFALVIFSEQLIDLPAAFAAKLGVLIIIFCLFGAAVNQLKKIIGFYPVFIAALWIPLEYFLVRHAGIGAILDFTHDGPKWLWRLGSLFGLLTISFLIMLINAVFLILLEYGKRAQRSRKSACFPELTALFADSEGNRAIKRRGILPNFRAPPAGYNLQVIQIS